MVAKVLDAVVNKQRGEVEYCLSVFVVLFWPSLGVNGKGLLPEALTKTTSFKTCLNVEFSRGLVFDCYGLRFALSGTR